MAIKVECYTLLTTVEIGKRCFPEQFVHGSCWNDGIICSPMGAMNPIDVKSMIEECESLGLRRFRLENGKNIIGDYFIASQFGSNLFMGYAPSDWIRVYNDVAWHPSFPMGKGIKTIPGYQGGYYYESVEMWQEAEMALMSYNKMFDDFFTGSLIKKTPFDDFFRKLDYITLMHQCL